MNNYIPEIAQTDKRDRFAAIEKVLTENGVPYSIQTLPFHGALGNIVVTFGKDKAEKKIVVAAHYDNVFGTPGANDNAAACSILLNLILETKENGTDKYLEFVFFDLEEMGFRGSRYFLQSCRKDDLLGVIDLDMCGLGNNTVASLHNGVEKILPVPTNGVTVLDKLPAGDAYTFIDADVPTVYVINSTDRDLAWFAEFAKTGIQPAGIPDFAYTMHRASDTPDICNLEQVEKICRFVSGCLQ